MPKDPFSTRRKDPVIVAEAVNGKREKFKETEQGEAIKFLDENSGGDDAVGGYSYFATEKFGHAGDMLIRSDTTEDVTSRQERRMDNFKQNEDYYKEKYHDQLQPQQRPSRKYWGGWTPPSKNK